MSLLGTLLRPKSFPAPSTIAAASCTATSGRCGGRRQEEYHSGRQPGCDSIGGRRRRRSRRQEGDSIENVFIRSLVSAGTCRACSTASHTRPGMGDLNTVQSRGPSLAARGQTKRAFSTARLASQSAAVAEARDESDTSRQEYNDLVDTYDGLTLLKARKPSLDHYRLAPRLAITPEQEGRPPYAQRQILEPIDEEHRLKLERLDKALARGPGHNTMRTWNAYFELPTPRLRYVDDRIVGRLFQHFAWVEKRDLKSSQRYFALLEDALSERVPIGAVHWNTAISFAGRWVKKPTSEDVKAAIETWLRMEREGGVSADNITFNILFDVAVKAERFALADTIHAEMERRGMEFNRYFRTSKIYYAGQRGDAENVRAAFRELVAAGEIVDTAIMNCVILSLVRCGEVASAENVMGKMKNLHKRKFGAASHADWRDKKIMGQRLHKSARKLRKDRNTHLASFFGSPYSDDDKKEEIQRAAPIAPDELTYRILIQWHSAYTGNLDKVRAYIADIQQAGWKVSHQVYFHLFRGFVKHGGYAFTAWNRKSLEAYWKAFVEGIAGDAEAREMGSQLEGRVKKIEAREQHAVYPLDPADSLESSGLDPNAEAEEEEVTDPPPSHLAPLEWRPGTVLAALAAFYKCAGLKRMLEVWDEVQFKWQDMGEDDRRRLKDLVDEKTRDAGVYLDIKT